MGLNITLHKQVVFMTSLCSLYYNFSDMVDILDTIDIIDIKMMSGWRVLRIVPVTIYRRAMVGR